MQHKEHTENKSRHKCNKKPKTCAHLYNIDVSLTTIIYVAVPIGKERQREQQQTDLSRTIIWDIIGPGEAQVNTIEMGCNEQESIVRMRRTKNVCSVRWMFLACKTTDNYRVHTTQLHTQSRPGELKKTKNGPYINWENCLQQSQHYSAIVVSRNVIKWHEAITHQRAHTHSPFKCDNFIFASLGMWYIVGYKYFSCSVHPSPSLSSPSFPPFFCCSGCSPVWLRIFDA